MRFGLRVALECHIHDREHIQSAEVIRRLAQDTAKVAFGIAEPPLLEGGERTLKKIGRRRHEVRDFGSNQRRRGVEAGYSRRPCHRRGHRSDPLRRAKDDVSSRAETASPRKRTTESLKTKIPGGFPPGTSVSDIDRREAFGIRTSAGSEPNRCRGSGFRSRKNPAPCRPGQRPGRCCRSRPGSARDGCR